MAASSFRIGRGRRELVHHHRKFCGTVLRRWLLTEPLMGPSGRQDLVSGQARNTLPTQCWDSDPFLGSPVEQALGSEDEQWHQQFHPALTSDLKAVGLDKWAPLTSSPLW